MRRGIVCRWFIPFFACLLLTPLARAGNGPSGMYMQPVPAAAGRWVTANHSAVIQIAPCGADLCGRIVGIVLGPNEPMPKDWRGASQCGLTIIRVSPNPGSNGASWSGSILDPRDGSVYNARIAPAAGHQLNLRGYLGLPIFGQTQTWNSYAAPIPPDCRLSSVTP